MARVILAAVLIMLLNVLVGCYSIDSGRSQILPARANVIPTAGVGIEVSKASEADLIEQVTINRQAYRYYVESLIAYYSRVGNNMKFRWAQNELAALNAMPKYNYILEAGLAGLNLKASASIPLADYMYQDARRIEEKAGQLIVIKDETLLRLALDKYKQLIKQHPTSDKIDDAAFRIGGICEYFKDYTIALMYYKRAYRWDPKTILPARFKAALILDRHMARRAEALGLYRQAIKNENLNRARKDFAEQRIAELSRSNEAVQENK